MRFALLLVLLSAPEAHAASSAKKLTAYESETFYHLSEEDFESFTCSVQSDLLTNMVQSLHSDFAALNGAITSSDTLDTFRMTFTKANDTLVFTRPELSIEIADPSRLQDETAVKEGLADVHRGFNMTVDGATQTIAGLYSEMQVSQLAKYRKVDFTPTENGYRAEYQSEGWQVTSEFEGTQKRIENRSPDGQSIESVQGYKEFPGKGLVLTGAETKSNGQLEISLEVQYATTSDLLLPSAYSINQKQLVQDQWVTTPMNITLSNCQVIRTATQ